MPMQHGDFEPTGIRRTLKMAAWGALALMVLGPALIQILSCLMPLVVLVGVVAAVLRVIWFYTRGW